MTERDDHNHQIVPSDASDVHTPGDVGVAGPGAVRPISDRTTFEAEIAKLRVRDKAHTYECDAIAAVRPRSPMVEVDADLTLIGPDGPVTLLDTFERTPAADPHSFMWLTRRPAAEQCEGCTWVTTQVQELSYLHSRGWTFRRLRPRAINSPAPQIQ